MRTFVIFMLLFAPSLAMAQSRPRLPDPLKVAAQLGGAISRPAASPIATPEELWKKVQAANATDLRYAKALADSVGSPGAKLRSACYGAWIATIEQAQSAGLKDAAGERAHATGPARVLVLRAARRGCGGIAADSSPDGRMRARLDRAQAHGRTVLHHGGQRRRRTIRARHRDPVSRT